MNPLVIIAGTYRGGTSMIAGILSECGAWTGRSMPANRHNPKGYFENEGLKSVLHLMLQISGYNDSDNLPPDDLIEGRSPDRLREILLDLMLNDGFREGTPVLKNPKITLFWRYFDFVFPNARWVIVRRSAEAVAASMTRVNVLTVPPVNPITETSLLEIVRNYHDRLDAIASQIPEERIREVSAEAVVAGNLAELESIVTWAGLTYNEERVRAFVEPAYFHSGPGKTNKSGRRSE